MTTINHSARVGVIAGQAGLAGGVAALYPDLTQKTA